MEEYLKNLSSDELIKTKRVIGQFITSCSHSMRGPLKSITGLVTLLQNSKGYSAQETAMFLELIGTTVNKMERTLDELEHFLENSKREVSLKLVDLDNLVNVVLSQHEEEIQNRHIEINLDKKQTSPLYSDTARLRIIFDNLLSNAIQFRDVNKPNKKIKITIDVNSQTCTLTVADNGIGIDPENHLKIFQLFFRASERSSGTGVGLYVVKEAVDKMGGNISVQSNPGTGSNFTIVLPNQLPL